MRLKAIVRQMLESQTIKHLSYSVGLADEPHVT